MRLWQAIAIGTALCLMLGACAEPSSEVEVPSDDGRTETCELIWSGELRWSWDILPQGTQVYRCSGPGGAEAEPCLMFQQPQHGLAYLDCSLSDWPTAERENVLN